jgi:diacylglycerol kinase (ATP)
MAKKSIGQHAKHILAATNYSLQGIAAAAKSETAFMQEILALFALPLAAWLYGVPLGGIIAVIAAWLFVMAIELLNMGLEAVCNLVSPDFHPLVKIAKDAGSAAVFVAITANALFWLYLACAYW